MVAVADVCDALTHRRSYKRAWTIAKAISEITTRSGTKFDPRVVAAFTSLDHRDYHHIAAADEPRANLEHITPAA